MVVLLLVGLFAETGALTKHAVKVAIDPPGFHPGIIVQNA